ncbi:MAG: hypothetical protein RR664_06970 [Clostridia bacterium]
MKKSGMSLIVLVITILVMIILAGVVVVSLSKNSPIQKAKEAMFKADASSFKDELNLSVVTKLGENANFNKKDINAAGKDMLKYIPSLTNKYMDKVEIVNAELVFVGDKESEKEWAHNVGLGFIKAPAVPSISASLIPIKWVNGVAVDTVVEDTEWADYQNKKWCNVRTKDGSMWTWIPRYAYRIIYYDKPVIDNKVPSSGKIVGYSDKRGLVDKNGKDNSFSRANGRVEVAFLGANNFKYFDGNKYTGDVRKKGGKDNPNNYAVHPAFSSVRRDGYVQKADGNFGSIEEIPGFFVSKFEMQPNCKCIPGNTAQRAISVNSAYAEGRNISKNQNIEGADSSLIKTTQWGAISYLAKAIGVEPNKNDNNKFLAGGGADNAYILNAGQSTTGNETGVYDMSGCSWEAMSAYVNAGILTEENRQNLIDNKDSKYVDVYAVSAANTQALNYDANADKYGDAQHEVSTSGISASGSWSLDSAKFPFGTSPVFYRGCAYNSDSGAGVFAFGSDSGKPNAFYSWRAVFTL